ncbi:MAG: hypothetical protein JRJ84_21740 [Deltaproteobacteria bacterium]|nr:hypothetical protein [Deltaproteobacteria bacterium]
MLRVLAPLLLLAAFPALAGEESPAGEEEGTLQAEYVRLSAELQRLVQRSAWSGAETAYRALLETGNPPSAEDHLFGAQAARALGDVAAVRERLIAVQEIEPSEEAAAGLAELDSLYGMVALRRERGSVDLSPQERPFRTDVFAAVAYVQEHVRENNSYSGPLAAGIYTLSGVPFEVTPGSDVLVVDTRKKAEVPPVASDPKVPKVPATSHEPPAPVAVLRLQGGVGWVAEREIGGQTSTALSGEVAVALPSTLRLEGSFADHLHEQRYLSVNPALDGAADVVIVDEQFQDARLGISLELLDLIGVDDLASKLDWRVSLAPRYLRLDSSAFGVWAGSLRIGTALRLTPADRFHLDASGGFGPRLFGEPDTLSAMGLPNMFWDSRVTAGFDFGDRSRWTVDLGWQMDSIVFEHTTRVLHGGTLGLSLSLPQRGH